MTEAARLAAELRDRIPGPPTCGPRAGIEHEHVVRAGDGRPLDFRTIVSKLEGLGPQLDPGDPNARRGPWGGVITADGREAEVATPPAPLRPGYTAMLAAWAVAGRAQLAAALPGCTLEGYSTHLSVSVRDQRATRVARRVTRHFGPALMLLLDGRDSPGLLVRPRRHRVELCGEYLTGSQRQVAAVFGAASVLAAGRLPARSLPPPVTLSVEPAVERFGFYLDRRACGPDIHASGRAAVLRSGRHHVTAEQILEASWTAARPFAVSTASPEEVALVDAVVEGAAALPVEERQAEDSGPVAAPTTPYGLVGQTRSRGTVSLEVVAATWDVTLLTVHDGAQRRFASVPSWLLEEVWRAVDRGDLDRLLGELLAAPARSLPTLRSSVGGDGFAVFGSIAGVHHMVPPERNLRTGRTGGGGAGSARRDQKGRDHTPRPRRGLVSGGAIAGLPRKVVVGGAVAVAALIVAAVAGAALLGGSDDAGDVTAARPDDPGARDEVGPDGSEQGELRPLAVDPCSLLDEGQVVGFANNQGGSYLVQGPITIHREPAYLVGGGSGPPRPIDDRYERYCTWLFDQATADGSGTASDGTVEVNVRRYEPSPDFEPCALFGQDLREVPGIGERAEVVGDHGLGSVFVADTCAFISYGGVADNESPSAAITEDILRHLAGEIARVEGGAESEPGGA